jgi:hypothetical protein
MSSYTGNTGGLVPMTITGASVNTNFEWIIPYYERKGEKMDQLTPETLAALGLSEDATGDEIEAAVKQLVTEVAPIREAAEAQRAFAEQFPAEAAMLAELRERDMEQSATLFKDSYAQLSSNSRRGFSAVALEMIADTHKKISTSSVTHEDFKQFLDLFADDKAIVDYTEHGTSREAESITAESAKDASKQIAALAYAAQAEAGGPGKLSWGDALAKVAAENPDLAAMYQDSIGGGGE